MYQICVLHINGNSSKCKSNIRKIQIHSIHHQQLYHDWNNRKSDSTFKIGICNVFILSRLEAEWVNWANNSYSHSHTHNPHHVHIKTDNTRNIVIYGWSTKNQHTKYQITPTTTAAKHKQNNQQQILHADWNRDEFILE